jgi:hypothetical protein
VERLLYKERIPDRKKKHKEAIEAKVRADRVLQSFSRKFRLIPENFFKMALTNSEKIAGNKNITIV